LDDPCLRTYSDNMGSMDNHCLGDNTKANSNNRMARAYFHGNMGSMANHWLGDNNSLAGFDNFSSGKLSG
jgi:hypothetical protein